MKRIYTRRVFIEPDPNPDQRLYVWAAGFFDGEGCITNQPYGAQMVVVQVVREPLDRLCLLFGGTIYQYETGGYRWVLQRRQYVLKALNLMLPYLTTKRPITEQTLSRW